MIAKNCPYCYKYYKTSKLNIQCIKCDFEFKRKNIKTSQKLLLKAGILPKIKKCPNCKEQKISNIIYKCPHCSQPLSKDLVELKSKTISIVGGRGSGKTIFISLLIDEMKKNIRIGEGRTLTVYNDDGRNIDIISSLQDKIKINKEMPDATEPVEVESEDSTAGIPLIYFYKGNNGAVSLSFYDSSGEDLQDYNTFQRAYDYVYKSSGIIFIMDIFSNIDNLRSTEAVLINLIKLIRLEKGINLNNKIPIPISFVLNKFDLYSEINERHTAWNGSNDEEILTTIEIVNSKILENFNDNPIENLGNLLQLCIDNFSTYKFIPVSSLGFDPIENKSTSWEFKPFDIEYPYVYLLNNI